MASRRGRATVKVDCEQPNCRHQIKMKVPMRNNRTLTPFLANCPRCHHTSVISSLHTDTVDRFHYVQPVSLYSVCELNKKYIDSIVTRPEVPNGEMYLNQDWKLQLEMFHSIEEGQSLKFGMRFINITSIESEKVTYLLNIIDMHVQDELKRRHLSLFSNEYNDIVGSNFKPIITKSNFFEPMSHFQYICGLAIQAIVLKERQDEFCGSLGIAVNGFNVSVVEYIKNEFGGIQSFAPLLSSMQTVDLAQLRQRYPYNDHIFAKFVEQVSKSLEKIKDLRHHNLFYYMESFNMHQFTGIIIMANMPLVRAHWKSVYERYCHISTEYRPNENRSLAKCHCLSILMAIYYSYHAYDFCDGSSKKHILDMICMHNSTFAYYGADEDHAHFCVHCGKFETKKIKLQVCRKCKVDQLPARFMVCSKECQIYSWPYHKWLHRILTPKVTA